MKLLVHILLIYFSIGACIPNCDFSQLLKINDLVEHYELHQKEASAIGQTISFSDFLYLHFVLGDEHQHEEEEQHENLPFQNISSPITLYLAFCSTTTVDSPAFTAGMLPSYGSVFQEDVAHDIFHPPSIA